MRNLHEYPLTTAEKVEALSWAIAMWVKEADATGLIGDVRGAALAAVRDDVLRQSIKEEADG